MATAPHVERRSSRPLRSRTFLRTIIAAWVGAVLAIGLFGSLTAPVSAFTVKMGVGFGPSGITELRVPPFGEVWAKTHRGPVVLRLTLTAVDPDRLKDVVQGGDSDSVLAHAKGQLVRAAERFLMWLATLALLGGAAGALLAQALFGRRREAGVTSGQWLLGMGEWKRAVVGATAGLVLFAAFGGWTYRSFDRSAFVTPHYEGALTAAPWLVGLVDEGISRAQELGQEMSHIADNMYHLFGVVGSLQSSLKSAPGDVTVLLVSDIHSNPVGVDLIRHVASTFDPDFILDTGDLDDYGTAVEGTFLSDLGSLNVPYVIVPGNHDSPAELAQLATLPSVRILESGEIVIDGVGIVGEADPSSRRVAPAVASAQELATQTEALRRDIALAKAPPTIIAAHIPGVVQPLAGLAPVLVAGHTHRLAVDQLDHSLYLNAGTTGAAGIRGLVSQDAPPYSLMVLYLKKDATGRLVPSALDTLQVTHTTGTVQMERRLFPSGSGAPATASPSSEGTPPSEPTPH